MSLVIYPCAYLYPNNLRPLYTQTTSKVGFSAAWKARGSPIENALVLSNTRAFSIDEPRGFEAAQKSPFEVVWV